MWVVIFTMYLSLTIWWMPDIAWQMANFLHPKSIYVIVATSHLIGRLKYASLQFLFSSSFNIDHILCAKRSFLKLGHFMHQV